MQSPTDINLRRVLVGHRAAVNVVDFDDKYIVSASGDRTIKVCISTLLYLNSYKTIITRSFAGYIIIIHLSKVCKNFNYHRKKWNKMRLVFNQQ